VSRPLRPADRAYSLSTRSGWDEFVTAPPRQRPELLSLAQIRQLSQTARAEYEERRSVWHANLGPSALARPGHGPRRQLAPVTAFGVTIADLMLHGRGGDPDPVIAARLAGNTASRRSTSSPADVLIRWDQASPTLQAALPGRWQPGWTPSTSFAAAPLRARPASPAPPKSAPRPCRR